MANNVKKEFELYEPMRLWLQQYLEDKYKNATVITVDSHARTLDLFLEQYDVIDYYPQTIGLDIQIDVLGIVKKNGKPQIFFIEAKKTQLNLHDLGQLWAYQKVAYSFSICLLMEMQWINSGSFHDGEFFHGPFEIVEKDVPFLLLMNDGRTRKMDSRALDFLNRFDAKTTVIDAKDFGLSNFVPSSVAEYFSPMVITGVLRVYAEQLSIVRDHPLSQRRYMWKLEY